MAGMAVQGVVGEAGVDPWLAEAAPAFQGERRAKPAPRRRVEVVAIPTALARGPHDPPPVGAERGGPGRGGQLGYATDHSLGPDVDDPGRTVGVRGGKQPAV